MNNQPKNSISFSRRTFLEKAGLIVLCTVVAPLKPVLNNSSSGSKVDVNDGATNQENFNISLLENTDTECLNCGSNYANQNSHNKQNNICEECGMSLLYPTVIKSVLK